MNKGGDLLPARSPNWWFLTSKLSNSKHFKPHLFFHKSGEKLQIWQPGGRQMVKFGSSSKFRDEYFHQKSKQFQDAPKFAKLFQCITVHKWIKFLDILAKNSCFLQKKYFFKWQAFLEKNCYFSSYLPQFSIFFKISKRRQKLHYFWSKNWYFW